jgi:hypothetical protein
MRLWSVQGVAGDFVGYSSFEGTQLSILEKWYIYAFKKEPICGNGKNLQKWYSLKIQTIPHENSIVRFLRYILGNQ